MNNSKIIETNQVGIHQDLERLVTKHLSASFKKPYQAHTLDVFKSIEKQVEKRGKPLIFDSCCGVGESSLVIAKRHPDAVVIAMDKSEVRLSKNEAYINGELPDNLILARVNLNDFWRLAVEAGWQLTHHYILYPNPWPKSKHIQRRWHGGPLFPSIIALGGNLELRSNWQVYIEEFAFALRLAHQEANISAYQSESAITPFERKYWLSGQTSWRVTSALSPGG